MPSAAIHYFTGTGNSYRIASIVEKTLTSMGYGVEMSRVGLDRAPPSGTYDMHVFAYPVYATDVPRPMAAYISRLPDGKGAKAALITAMGNSDAGPGHQGYDGVALTHAARLLRSRGYDVFFEDVIGYPGNITMIYSPPAADNIEAIRKESDPKVEAMAEKIAAGERHTRRVPAAAAPLCGLFGLLYGIFGRRALSMLLVANGACNTCRKCASSCPSGAITIRDCRPYWNLRCEGCQRCINVCPQQAIQCSLTKALTLALITILALIVTTALFFLPFGDYLPGLALAGVTLQASTYGLAIIAALWVAVNLVFPMQLLSAIFRAMETVPGMKKLYEISYTKNYRRYIDPKFDPLEPGPETSAQKK